MTKVNEYYQDPTQKVPANSPTKIRKISENIGKLFLGNSQKTPPVPVELREIIMKKKSLGFLLNKVRRSLFNDYMIQEKT